MTPETPSCSGQGQLPARPSAGRTRDHHQGSLARLWCGVVLYAGRETLPFGPLWAVRAAVGVSAARALGTGLVLQATAAATPAHPIRDQPSRASRNNAQIARPMPAHSVRLKRSPKNRTPERASSSMVATE